jgi:DNA topoisomerase I
MTSRTRSVTRCPLRADVQTGTCSRTVTGLLSRVDRESAVASRPDAAPPAPPGLRHASDCEPGIRRVRRGDGFAYRLPDGRALKDANTLARIRSLAIPPAYKDVWICATANGHLQATGRDARGRKQYRYHPKWRSHRDETKFDRMLEFGRVLPRIRACVSRDLRKSGMPRERVLATVVRLLEKTLIRVGNEEYARSNGSFGLTTLRDRHVARKGGEVHLVFRGKSGIAQRIPITDKSIARLVIRCQDIPGQELFQWLDDAGERRRIDSNDVNDYLREASGGDFTAKDYRTWFATVDALEFLRTRSATTEREAKRHTIECIAEVALRLGNTPAVCRKCYIHPEVLAAYLDGRLAALSGLKSVQALRRLLKPSPKSLQRKKNPTAGSGRRIPRSPPLADGIAAGIRLR